MDFIFVWCEHLSVMIETLWTDRNCPPRLTGLRSRNVWWCSLWGDIPVIALTYFSSAKWKWGKDATTGAPKRGNEKMLANDFFLFTSDCSQNTNINNNSINIIIIIIIMLSLNNNNNNVILKKQFHEISNVCTNCTIIQFFFLQALSLVVI